MSSLLTSDSLPSLVVTSNMMSSTTNTAKPDSMSPVITNIQQGVDMQTTEAQEMLLQFWPKQLDEIQNMDVNDFKVQELPLARIKKIMKMDEDVKMISAEAPLLFAKAAQMFITELSLRAWIHTEDNKRRTLQRNDIATAITKFDQFDFLIDIVPREELKPARRPAEEARSSNDPVQYFYTVPQQGQSQQGTATVINQPAPQTSASTLQSNQISLPQNSQMQIVQISPNNQVIGGEGTQQIIQLAQPQQQGQQQIGNANTIVVGNNQQQSQNIVLNSQQESQQINSALLQQLISSTGGSSGEISAIQINADGQLQIIKVPSNTAGTTQDGNQQLRNDQNQQTVTLGTDNVQHIFNIPATS